MSSKRCVGELNGKWAALFQASLILAPLVVGIIVSMLGWLSYETILASTERMVMKTQIDKFDLRQHAILLQLAQIESALHPRQPPLVNTPPLPHDRLQPSGH